VLLDSESIPPSFEGVEPSLWDFYRKYAGALKAGSIAEEDNSAVLPDFVYAGTLTFPA
jgi:hypothetical protein